MNSLIINQHSPPEKSLFYIGARILESLNRSMFPVTDVLSGYRRLQDSTGPGIRISFAYYLLALDWLFLLGKVDITESGDIIKCS